VGVTIFEEGGSQKHAREKKVFKIEKQKILSVKKDSLNATFGGEGRQTRETLQKIPTLGHTKVGGQKKKNSPPKKK